MDRIEFIAQQLRALAPSADWKASGLDRSIELARILDRNGILDLGRLRIVPVKYEEVIPEGVFQGEGGDVIIPETRRLIDSFAFEYDGRRIGYMGTPDRIENGPAFEVWPRGFLAAWSSDGHGHVGYIVRPNTRRNGIEIVPQWDSSSDAANVRSTLLQLAQFVAFVALPLAGVSIGSTVGSYVFGPGFAAAYPTIATAVGNAAVATVFNGGDVVGAAKNAALGAVGGGVGGALGAQVHAMTDSPLFGQLVSSVASSAITGGDAKSAAIQTLLRGGVSMMTFDSLPGIADLLPIDGANPPTFDDGGVMVGYDFPAWQFDPLPPTFDTGGGGGDSPQWDWSGGSGGSDAWDWLPTDLPQYEGSIPDLAPVSIPDVTIAQPGAPGVPIRSDSPLFTAQQMIGTVTSAAMAALQLVTAFKQLDRPSIQTTARYVQGNGAVSVIGSNGLVQTRSPSGTVSYTRPPVGVPQTTVDGRLIVNNGDGTYTSISAGGQSQVMPYQSATGGGSLGSIPPALLIGGAVIAFLALGKRR